MTEEDLGDDSPGAEKTISNDLKAHARRWVWPEGAQDGKWSSTAATAEECYNQVEQFMAQGFWPLIKVVWYVKTFAPGDATNVQGRVFLRAAVLKTGVILADLPGREVII